MLPRGDAGGLFGPHRAGGCRDVTPDGAVRGRHVRPPARRGGACAGQCRFNEVLSFLQTPLPRRRKGPSGHG
eukprot:3972255-Pyramimonas_sp.AAC.1